LVEEYFAVSITGNGGYKASLKQIIKSVIDIYAVEKGNENEEMTSFLCLIS
jgi:hypothetical protein